MEVSEVASSGTGNVHGIIVGGQVSPVKVRSDLTSSILKDRFKAMWVVLFEPT